MIYYKQIFDDEIANTRFILKWVFFGLMCVSVGLTILFWSEHNFWFFLFLILNVLFCYLWFWQVSWLTQRKDFLKLKKFISSSKSEPLLKPLVKAYINNQMETAVKMKTNQTLGWFCGINKENQVDFLLYMTKKKEKCQMYFRINEAGMKYSIVELGVGEMDIEDWVLLEKKAGLWNDVDGFIDYILAHFKKCETDHLGSKIHISGNN